MPGRRSVSRKHSGRRVPGTAPFRLTIEDTTPAPLPRIRLAVRPAFARSHLGSNFPASRLRSHALPGIRENACRCRTAGNPETAGKSYHPRPACQDGIYFAWGCFAKNRNPLPRCPARSAPVLLGLRPRAGRLCPAAPGKAQIRREATEVRCRPGQERQIDGAGDPCPLCRTRSAGPGLRRPHAIVWLHGAARNRFRRRT
jgi:hypothetical protein